jgi:multisubunit Na+/H+ antiporter MnhG subunit
MTEYLEIVIRVTGLILFTIPSIGIIRDSYRQQKEAEELLKARRHNR